MVIKASSSTEVRSLIEGLLSSDGTRAEAAIARLTIIGRRATDRLIGAYGVTTASAARVRILRALEGIADPRALPLACAALQDGADAAVAAAAVLKPLLNAQAPAVAAAALDALIDVALDPSRERRVRLAAYDALEEIPADMLAKVSEVLEVKPQKAGREAALNEALFADAVDGRLPDDPTQLREAVMDLGSKAPLTSIQKLIDAVRAREQSSQGGVRASWLQVRGAAHQALALRGSSVAVYDLRETVEAADGPLPPAFLSAMRGVGDASCVEALASALARAPEGDLWWRHQLASALRGIARRERMTRRHASMKRALARWPRAADALR